MSLTNNCSYSFPKDSVHFSNFHCDFFYFNKDKVKIQHTLSLSIVWWMNIAWKYENCILLDWTQNILITFILFPHLLLINCKYIKSVFDILWINPYIANCSTANISVNQIWPFWNIINSPIRNRNRCLSMF